MCILVPPSLVFDFERQNINVTAGEMIVFMCNSTGFPMPSISWYKNNILLVETNELNSDNFFINNYIINNLTIVSQLMIHRLDLSDNGYYHCQSANNLVTNLVNISNNVSLFVLSK